jgi:uncharacterized protein (DUF1501 family)
MLDRRDFLTLSLASGAALSLRGSVFARAARSAPAGNDRVLVLLELTGGNDGLATLVPFEDDRFWRARKTLAHDKATLLKIDDGRGLNVLHPALKNTAARFARGQVAFVQGVGYANQNLSHFVSRDIWAAAPSGPNMPPTGWLGNWRDRELASSDDPLAMLEVGTSAVPYSLRSRVALAPAVESLETYGFVGAMRNDVERDGGARRLECMRALHATPSGEPTLDYVQDNFNLAQRTSAILRTTLTPKSKAAYPPTRIGQDLKLVAGVIAHGLPTRVFHVQASGFDTHVKQRRDHERLLAQVDAAVEAFLVDLEARGLHERVSVLSISEFGRRVQESGLGEDAGTDHGAASVQIAWGAKVRGGVIGEQPDLEHLDRDGNLVARIDFRRVYTTVIEQWLGGDADAMLGGVHEPLELFAKKGA